MPNKIACVDIDGVVFDFIGMLIKRFGEGDLSKYSISEMYPNLPQSEIEEFVHDPANYLDASPVPNALWGLDRLRKAGYEIVFCTVRPIENKHTAKWLDYYLVDYKEINRFNTVDEKLEYIKKTSPDVAIDDKQEIIERLTESGIHSVLIAQPWNCESLGIVRAKDWLDAVNLVTGSNDEV